jgi:hypothetical protein
MTQKTIEWDEFYEKHEQGMLEFFEMEFPDAATFLSEKIKYEEKYFQQFSTLRSQLIQNNDLLKEKFQYQWLKLKCKHGSTQRSNITKGNRPNQHTNCLGCPFSATISYDSKQ